MRYALIILTIMLGAHVAWAAVDTDSVFEKTGTYTTTDGKELYAENCRGCHMPEGKGVRTGAGMYPALAQNPNVTMPDYTAYVLMNGLRGMPSFEADMTDEQITAAANYVSANFGNKPASELKGVAAIRPAKSVEYVDY